MIEIHLYNYVMPLDTIFFDLDATLYPESNGLWPAIRAKIDQFMYEIINIPEADIPKLREYYYIQYGTTLRGLQNHYGIKAEEYLSYVHDLPLRHYLKPDPILRDMLLSIPHRRWIFTNSDKPHAQRVLSILEIEDCFDGLVDVYALEPYCKPIPEAYKLALDIAKVSNSGNCAILDDSPHNLTPAKEMGFFTVLVGQNRSHPTADRVLENIHDLPKVAPELWET
jgi:pyrimidine 5'-nucleotidase